MSKQYETVIGLEVHVELATRTKIFCGCSTAFGGAPNTHTCPVCTGMPGSLPVLNKKVVDYALRVGLAANCKINQLCKFDRKNYFYPDNPQNYQISQLYLPICHDGYVEIDTAAGKKKIGIHEIHMEEDAGKLIHDEWEDCSLVDYNRSGVDVERTYHLMDMYIQECEQLQTLKEINDLQYQMLFDFCEKAGETHIPSGISADIYACMNYIRSHTNEAIRLEDVAAHIDRSTSFIAKKFKSELGFNPGAYISRCKLEEAKSLLTFTEKSLTEISNYLCYSSQAHFQTAFKKKYGMTPRQYRNKTQQI